MRPKEEILKAVNEYFRNATGKEQQDAVSNAVAERKRRAEEAVEAADADGSGEERAGEAANGDGGLRDNGRGRTKRSSDQGTGNLAETGDVDDKGHRFVTASNGSTTFGQITQDSGLAPAPIKLSEGFNIVGEDGNNHGYGLLHIEAEHGQQILEAGYASVKDFVEDVTKNYQEIRIARNRKGNETFMLLELHDEKHKRTLYVELSNDGTYWNVNSGGIFKNKYTDKKDIVWPEPTVGSNANTDTTEVVDSPAKAAKGETVDRGGNSSQTISSAGKATDNAAPAQGTEGKSDTGGGEKPRQGGPANYGKPFESVKEAKDFLKSIGYKGKFSEVLHDKYGKKFIKYQANGVVTPNIYIGSTTPMDVLRTFALYDNMMDVNIPDSAATIFAREKEEAAAASKAAWAEEVDAVKDYLKNELGIAFHTVIESEWGVRIVYTDKKNEYGNYTEYTDYRDLFAVIENADFIKAEARKYSEKEERDTKETPLSENKGVKKAQETGIDWSTSYDKAPKNEDEWMDMMRFEYAGSPVPEAKDMRAMKRLIEKALSRDKGVGETTSGFTNTTERSAEIYASHLYMSEKAYFSSDKYGDFIAFFDEGEKAVYRLVALKDPQGHLKRVILIKETFCGSEMLEQIAKASAEKVARERELDGKYHGFLKGKSGLRRSFAERALGKRGNYGKNIGVMSAGEFVEMHFAAGDLSYEKKMLHPPYPRNWNAMNGFEQEEWEKKHPLKRSMW